MFLRRPPNSNYSTVNITLNDEGRVLHEIPGFVPVYHKENDSVLRSRSSNLTGRAKQNINENANRMSRAKLEDNELPYFFVTLHLTQDLCLWGEPVVCQYFTEVEEILPDASLVEDRKSIMRKRKLSRLLSLKKSTKKSSFLQESDQMNIFRPTWISAERQSIVAPPDQTVVPVKNFPLLKGLNHNEIRQLERYCVPRIISSFKLPQEVREEIQMSQKPKPKNILTRRRSAEETEVLDLSYIDFDFDGQDAPERMFPIFNNVEHVILEEVPEGQVKVPDPKSAYGVLNTLDGIRHKYNDKYLSLMSQPDYVPSKKLGKKKLVPQKTDDLRQSSIKILEHAENRDDDSISVVDNTAGSVENAVIRKSELRFHDSVLSTKHESLKEDISRETSKDTTRDTIRDTIRDSIERETIESLKLERKVVHEKPRNKVTHWTTKYILSSHFDRKSRTISVKTDRLGIFGLAFKRYEHFPFRDWCLQPNEEK